MKTLFYRKILLRLISNKKKKDYKNRFLNKQTNKTKKKFTEKIKRHFLKIEL